MANIISSRKDEVNQIAAIMNDINAIANDIAKETAAQGEKLQKIDEDLAVADKNAEEGVN